MQNIRRKHDGSFRRCWTSLQSEVIVVRLLVLYVRMALHDAGKVWGRDEAPLYPRLTIGEHVLHSPGILRR